MADEETVESVEWEQWLPPERFPKQRPAGVIAIYKLTGTLKVFKDSFLGLKGDLGILDSKEKLWKFITLYVPTTQTERQQRLGFRLHLEKTNGTLDLIACSDNGFRISLKHALTDLNYSGFLDKTSYFKVQYDEANKMHFIEFGKPDYEWKKGEGFSPPQEEEETEK